MERNGRIRGDGRTLEAMIALYCRDKHGSPETLCSDCRAVLDYAKARLTACPFGEKKPICARCPIHCYRPAMRGRIGKIMKYAGPRMLRKHPILVLRHVLHGLLYRQFR